MVRRRLSANPEAMCTGQCKLSRAQPPASDHTDRSCASHFNTYIIVYSLKSSAFCHFYSFKPETCLHLKTANTLIRYVQGGSLVYLSHECFHVPHPITPGLAGPTGRNSLAGPIAHTVEAQPLPNHVLCTPHNTLHSPTHID